METPGFLWHELLSCPVCHHDLHTHDGALRCAAGHAFDIARQGYVNLLPGGAHTGTADSPEMVAARSAFLSAGHYEPLVSAVAAVSANAIDEVPGCVADCGAGTGEYLAAVLEALPGRQGLALDISKFAARIAARVHPRAGAVVCDTWAGLPLRDDVAALVLCIFAPRNAEEFARVLAPGGALVTVTPTAGHLAELIAPLGLLAVDSRKEERLESSLGGHFVREAEQSVEVAMTLSQQDAVTLALMGPAARHATREELEERARRLPAGVHATLSATVSTWRVLGESA